MVNPSRVMVAAALAATVPVDNVITTLEDAIALALAAAPLSKTLEGVPPAATKPEGYISVIVLLAESAPPAVGMNENVAITFTLLTTRSFCAMRKDVKFDEPPINPDATEGETVGSALVCTVTAPPAVGVPLMIKPVSVTVTAALAASCATDVVTTIRVRVGCAQLPLAPPLTDAPGVAVAAKKPDGYVRVMVPPAAIAPPAEVVKTNVAAAPVSPATRSADAIQKEVPVTVPPITPDAVPAEAVGSTLVAMVTAPPPVAAPTVKPVSVTVTAVLAASGAPPVVMTMEVAPGACGVREAPAVDSVAVGAGDVAKKPDG
jgi:hypothetical protein